MVTSNTSSLLESLHQLSNIQEKSKVLNILSLGYDLLNVNDKIYYTGWFKEKFMIEFVA
jgi:hypothetical protein